MKKICLFLALCLLLVSCASKGDTRQSSSFFDVFDTVTSLIGYAYSAEEFSRIAASVHEQLLRYHRLFDIYNDYEGLNNLKTVNDCAGRSPVAVDAEIIAFLRDCKAYYALTDGLVNVAMGGVLQLWHDAREEGLADPENARLPDMDALRDAAAHCDIDAVEIDEEKGTVFIRDARVRLDVGALAKGWACQRVAENAPKGLLLSVGGNVCATGEKKADTAWVIGVQDPDGGADYLQTIRITCGSVVTSGDYMRTYTVGGESYHHIIDPQTLMPSRYWRSVTVVCDDSALADALSTALFLLPYEQGVALLQRTNAQVMWVAADGTQYFSDGFSPYLDA